jgi:hypothetical protein
VRRQMSRSKDFWEGSETNQSPGNGPVWAAADICDSLAPLRKSLLSATGVPSGVPQAESFMTDFGSATQLEHGA